jgi:hypothetical protein
VRFAHGANNPPFRGRTAKGWATRLGGRWSRLAFLRGRGDRLEGFGAEAADAAVGAYGVGERECVPVLVGVGLRARQLRPSSVEMSVPLGPTVIQVLSAVS